ncbi:MAG: hypothetical protein QY331_01765 [Melioribacteraceae bacterium]|nr:MAG: hypothetical protein QY331_01765 [Melioribacteraceae bacterium]
MPLNLLKVYNQLLEIDHLSEIDRTASLKGIFNRDIRNNTSFKFREKQINPISVETDAMDILFKHLTTVKINNNSAERTFEPDRSKRLHWIKHHIEENKTERMLIFSVEDPEGVRTYIFDEDENYVIILEPYRNESEYYLLTAYYLNTRNRKKIRNKYKRKLETLI